MMGYWNVWRSFSEKRCQLDVDLLDLFVNSLKLIFLLYSVRRMREWIVFFVSISLLLLLPLLIILGCLHLCSTYGNFHLCFRFRFCGIFLRLRCCL